MHKHHVIPRHEWKVRFGNLRGFNAPDNVVYLTIDQHAQTHQLLYELNNNPYDYIAWKTLSGQIGKDEAFRQAVSVANTGKDPWNKGKTGIYSQEQKQRLSEAAKGHTFHRGRKHTPTARENMSASHIGKRHSAETRMKMKNSQQLRRSIEKSGV